MAEDNGKQEVVVTDIEMRFTSMVIFMVKWAIASIPALIILVALAVAFSGLAIGFFASLSGLSHRQSTSGDLTKGKGAVTTPFGSPSVARTPSVEEAAYLPKVLVKGVTVGKSVLDETRVFGEIKNTGDRTLNKVEITILEWSPFLRQTAKTQNSANGMKMPSKGGLSHGFVSTAVHEGVQVGGDSATGDGGVGGGGGASF